MEHTEVAAKAQDTDALLQGGVKDAADPEETALKELLIQAKYIVFFTGAGISASAGIGTFRGDTAVGSLLEVREDLLDAVFPTYAHLAITRLIEAGKAQFVVTSNHDNLHRRTGLKEEKLAELFGCAYVEKCLKCKKQYTRKVSNPPLGRVCDDDACGGKLTKTGVRYGQSVPEAPVTRGFAEADKCDLAIVLGSSMDTGPFCEMPGRSGRFVLVNPSATRHDDLAEKCFHMPSDEFMRKMMKIFNIKAGSWTLEQDYDWGYDRNGETAKLFVRGHFKNEACTLIENVEVSYNGLVKDMDKSSRNLAWELDIRDPTRSLRVEIKVTFVHQLEIPPHTLVAVLGDEKLLGWRKVSKKVLYAD